MGLTLTVVKMPQGKGVFVNFNISRATLITSLVLSMGAADANQVLQDQSKKEVILIGINAEDRSLVKRYLDDRLFLEMSDSEKVKAESSIKRLLDKISTSKPMMSQ